VPLVNKNGAPIQLRRRTIDFCATSPPSPNFVCHSFQKRPGTRHAAAVRTSTVEPAGGRSAHAHPLNCALAAQSRKFVR
jgi:hypothetical protein